MYDVVVLTRVTGTLNEFRGVFYGCDVVVREVEELRRELMHHWVDLNHGGFNSVVDECRWSAANAESTILAVSLRPSSLGVNLT